MQKSFINRIFYKNDFYMTIKHALSNLNILFSAGLFSPCII